MSSYLLSANAFVRQNLKEEIVDDARIIETLSKIQKDKEFPKIFSVLEKVFSHTSRRFSPEIFARIYESKVVIDKVLDLAFNNHIRVIVGLMNVSVGRSANLTALFDTTFASLNSKAGRFDAFGTTWHLPILITMGLIEDIKNDIDIFNPSKEDLLNSSVIRVSTLFFCPRQEVDRFISSLN